MSGWDYPEQDRLDRLTDLLVEDVLSTSDEDMLAEVREEKGDPERYASEMRALFESSLVSINNRSIPPNLEDHIDRRANAVAQVIAFPKQTPTSPMYANSARNGVCGRRSQWSLVALIAAGFPRLPISLRLAIVAPVVLLLSIVTAATFLTDWLGAKQSSQKSEQSLAREEPERVSIGQKPEKISRDDQSEFLEQVEATVPLVRAVQDLLDQTPGDYDVLLRNREYLRDERDALFRFSMTIAPDSELPKCVDAFEAHATKKINQIRQSRKYSKPEREFLIEQWAELQGEALKIRNDFRAERRVVAELIDHVDAMLAQIEAPSPGVRTQRSRFSVAEATMHELRQMLSDTTVALLDVRAKLKRSISD